MIMIVAMFCDLISSNIWAGSSLNKFPLLDQDINSILKEKFYKAEQKLMCNT